MALLKSLFCFSGCDLPGRFGLISLGVYLFLLCFNGLFGALPALLFVSICLLLVILTAVSLRRLRDANLPPTYSAAPLGIFLFCSIGIVFIDHASSYFLLVLAIMATLALMAKASRQSANYVFGYSGPVDMSEFQAAKGTTNHYANRVEPTFIDGQSEHHEPQVAQPSPVNQFSEPTHQFNLWIAPIKNWVLSHQQLTLAGVGLISLFCIVIATLSLWQVDEAQEEIAAQTPVVVAPPVKVREHALEMPDTYYLMLDENQGLVIHWPSSDDDNPLFWSILSAKGEQSCQDLVFNDKIRYRTNRVAIENDGDYFASFSPLDTHVIVKAIADKSSFSLCGFDFSLKGSRSALDTSRIFFAFLEQ
jgi:hypothetical protein